MLIFVGNLLLQLKMFQKCSTKLVTKLLMKFDHCDQESLWLNKLSRDWDWRSSWLKSSWPSLQFPIIVIKNYRDSSKFRIIWIRSDKSFVITVVWESWWFNRIWCVNLESLWFNWRSLQPRYLESEKKRNIEYRLTQWFGGF